MPEREKPTLITSMKMKRQVVSSVPKHELLTTGLHGKGEKLKICYDRNTLLNK